MSKIERKTRRKQCRAFAILSKREGIQCTDRPTKIIVVCNAGLVSGIERGELLQLFTSVGPVERLVMEPGKSYSFIVYKSEDFAVEAMEKVNGKESITGLNGPLYLTFASEIPEVKDCWPLGNLPDGLVLLENFVSDEEEQKMLSCVDWSSGELHTEQSLKHRRVRHFGYEFNYKTSNVDKDSPLPQQVPLECARVFERLTKLGYINCIPDQLTVNQYEPGQGIPPHVDTHSAFEDPILSLSLGAPVVMDFRHPDGKFIQVLLPQRSLLIMSGESRYVWTHGITPRKTDVVPTDSNGLTVQHRKTRTSFTFRKVRDGGCNCSYPSQCDTQKELTKGRCELPSLSNDIASELERIHVHQVYEEIADHFSETRHKPWHNIEQFVMTLEPGSLLIDIGCGNGKYLGLNKSIVQMGCDRSHRLAKICRERSFQAFTCDCLAVPIRSNIADACISIAVYHHLATSERRLKALEELVRILKPGGRGLVYVWAQDQERDKVKSSYLKQRKQNKIEPPEQHLGKELLIQHSSAKGSSLIPNTETPTVLSSKTTDVPETESSIADSAHKIVLPVHTNRTNFQHKDLLVPWKIKPQQKQNAEVSNDITEIPIFHRYYHVFEEGELEMLCSEIKNVGIVKHYYDQGNWCVVLQKLES